MYTDEDLNVAVENGIFTAASVDEFRTSVSTIKDTPLVDEENFRLIGGFNDIFVVIACCLLLFSTVFVLKPINEILGLVAFVAISWGLSEFFVLRRKMSLPAIVLLISFVGGVFYLATLLFPVKEEVAFIVATGLSAIAAYGHWLRFKVPITVAAGTVAFIGLIVFSILGFVPNSKDWILAVVVLCGVGSFCIAMYWDSSDTKRVTRKSDVAFWLHLLSAPLIIHPVFVSLGVLENNQSILNLLFVVALYVLMTLVSIVIDRRAFMVSSLIYVLYAITSIMKTYGDVGYSFALTGVLMGAMLLLLSAFWKVARIQLVGMLPMKARNLLPTTGS